MRAIDDTSNSDSGWLARCSWPSLVEKLYATVKRYISGVDEYEVCREACPRCDKGRQEKARDDAGRAAYPC